MQALVINGGPTAIVRTASVASKLYNASRVTMLESILFTSAASIPPAPTVVCLNVTAG